VNGKERLAATDERETQFAVIGPGLCNRSYGFQPHEHRAWTAIDLSRMMAAKRPSLPPPLQWRGRDVKGDASKWRIKATTWNDLVRSLSWQTQSKEHHGVSRRMGSQPWKRLVGVCGAEETFRIQDAETWPQRTASQPPPQTHLRVVDTLHVS